MNRTDRYTAPWVAITAVLLWGMHSAIAAPAGADYFPNVPLVNQDGETLHFYDDQGQGGRHQLYVHQLRGYLSAGDRQVTRYPDNAGGSRWQERVYVFHYRRP